MAIGQVDEAVRCLLEKKHLYQAIVVNQQALVKELLAELICEQAKGDFDEVVAKAEQALSDDWHILDEISRQGPRYPIPAGIEYRSTVTVFIRSIAGFLYLRVLIEQHVRSVVGDSESVRPDEALARYSEQIPKGIRRWLPSLKERYGLLSAAFHSASWRLARSLRRCEP